MERNLDRRVETLCRVRDRRIIRHLRDVVLDAYLRDNDRAYLLEDSRTGAEADTADGHFNAQRFLLEWYTLRLHEHDDG